MRGAMSDEGKNGKLYVVATPIGNLEDITLRALRVLREVDCVAAEDTRHSRRLLEHFGIEKEMVSYHEFNEAKRTEEFLVQLREGKTIALISDAGMPGVSDPGERLIRACGREGITVEVVPGPSAVLQALVAAGFSMTPFYFGGFLPVKSGKRQRELAEARDRGCTSVYFESPHRFLKSLADVQLVMPERLVCVARELTKRFEEVRWGTARELLAHYEKQGVKGEICIVIEGNKKRRAEKTTERAFQESAKEE